MRSLSKSFVINLKRTFPTRLKIGLMLFIGSFMIFMLRSNFSIIIIAMAETYHWSNHEQNLLLSAYFCGYVGPNLIAGAIAERFGGRIVIFFVFLLSSIITALAPYSTSQSSNFLFLSRLTLGFCGVRKSFLSYTSVFFENFFFSFINSLSFFQSVSIVHIFDGFF